MHGSFTAPNKNRFHLLPLNDSEAGVDFVLIETSPFFVSLFPTN